jgi:hypothetical protein
MYAKGSPDDLYHLLTVTEDETLCGLKVTQIVIDRPVNVSTEVHVTFKRPIESKLCEDCSAHVRDRVASYRCIDATQSHGLDPPN